MIKKIFRVIQKILIFLLLLCVVAYVVVFTLTKLSSNRRIYGPTTTVQIIDSIYNFKTITEGDTVQYKYYFKNTGKNSLIITDAKSSCGCTIPERPKTPIAPGDTGFIGVKFFSKNRPGNINKTITITSNVIPNFPVLVLKGVVIK
jgi:hypothetical protein